MLRLPILELKIAVGEHPGQRQLAYMLVGYDHRETWERVLYCFHKMADIGIRPFPMVFGDRRRGLPGELPGQTPAQFQRLAVRRLYTVVPFADYDPSQRTSSAAFWKVTNPIYARTGRRRMAPKGADVTG
jgi:hypothetical protein